MAQTSFPFENIDTTETQFSKWARNFNSGVDDVPTGSALEVSAGSGLAVDVAVGEAMVRGHYYISDAIESLALATADATNDRLDTVVLRLDPSANTIVLAVKTGTPAGSPTAPALVQTDAGVFEQPLADVLVAANSGVPGTITDRREFMGTRLGSWSTVGRPVPAGRVLFGFNTDTETIEFYNTVTSAWEDVTPASIGDIGDVTITSATADDLLQYDGTNWVNVDVNTALGAGKILQVVSTTKTDTFSTASTSFVDVTGLSATITPISATSKILVTFHVHAGQSAALFTYFQLLRDSTAIALGDADGSRTRVTALTYSGTSDNTSQLNPNVGQFLDSPATTSAVTYKLQMRVNTGTGYVNRTALDTNNTTYMRAVSGITIMEVAA